MVKAGFAQTVISPPLGTYLCGYPNTAERAATGVLLDLKAKALYLSDGKKNTLIITADLIGLNRNLIRTIREEIIRAIEIEEDAILIACSHTHSGPIFSKMKDCAPDPNYIFKLTTRLAEIAEKATIKLVPVKIGSGTGQVDLCHNRRVVKDGKAVNVWQDHEHAHQGIVDKTVYVLKVTDESDKTLAAIVNYACHPVVMGPPNKKISSDYPGYLQQYLERVFPGCQAMFTNAGGGNANPYVCIGDDDAEARKMGETLGREAEKVLNGIKTEAPADLSYTRLHLDLEPQSNPSERLKARPEKTGGAIRTETQLIRIGGILIVTAPGELLVEVALKLKEQSPIKPTFVFAYANDYIGYMPPDEIISQGGYEVNSAPSHNVEQPLLTALKEGIGKL